MSLLKDRTLIILIGIMFIMFILIAVELSISHSNVSNDGYALKNNTPYTQDNMTVIPKFTESDAIRKTEAECPGLRFISSNATLDNITMNGVSKLVWNVEVIGVPNDTPQDYRVLVSYYVGTTKVYNIVAPNGTIMGSVSALRETWDATTGEWTPSNEYFSYIAVPPLTQEQKDKALKIALASDVYKEYKQYPHSYWTYFWNYPYDGHNIFLSTIINPQSENDTSTVFGLLSFNVDIDNNNVTYAGFLDWHEYY